MTEKKLKELAKAAGYEIKHGFTHSEEGSQIPNQSGYEIVNAYSGEAVTHSACGETWHFAYTLEEVEDFLKNVYEQSGVKWEPEIGEEEASAIVEELSDELIPIFKEFVKYIKGVICQKARERVKTDRINKKAMELLPDLIDLDNLSTDDLKKEMEKCRNTCESVSSRVAGLRKDEELDINTITVKLMMIEWILDTPVFGLGGGENLFELAYAMAKERVLQLEHDALYTKQEAAE